MSRVLPLALAAVITAGVTGAALLPDPKPAAAQALPGGLSARTDSAITPVSPLDWSTAGMTMGRALSQQKAAQQRAAKAAAAEEARKARARAAERRASRSRFAPVAYGSPRAIARTQLAARGWSDQFGCLDSLWSRESGWRVYASNASGAYGIPQALPGSKMASAGDDWRTNPATQIRWGLGYIAASYGSPCAAWQHSESHGWY
ncbi:MAG: lytic transglycosylase protein [Frankiales bacterium]|nr:lytic transglycosylase protein [Frankiales bacterium]